MATSPKLTEEEIADANKKASDKVRDAIKVDGGEEKEVVEEKKEETEEVTEEEAKELQEEVAASSDKIEESEKTEEQLKAEKKEAETKDEKDKIQRRIDREIAKRKKLEEENAELKAQLSAKPDASLTEEEVEKRSETKAAQKQAQREFIATSNRLYDEAVKLDKDFEKKVKDLVDDVGQIPSMLIDIIGDLKNGANVLTYLTNNHDKAERYYALAVNRPVKAGVELAELAISLRPEPKKVSKVPAPNEPINGGNRNGPVRENMSMSTEEWIRTRNARLRAEGKA